MDERRREEFVTAVEQTAVRFGARSYEGGLDQVIVLCSRLLNFMESIRTKDALRNVLASADEPTKSEERMILFFIRHSPQFVKIVCSLAFAKFVAALPPFAPGRPRAFNPEQRDKLVDFIYALHRQKVPFAVAKQRAAQRFGCSVRTVERLLAVRGEVGDDCASPEEISGWASREI